jgi:hypothetical protein
MYIYIYKYIYTYIYIYVYQIYMYVFINVNILTYRFHPFPYNSYNSLTTLHTHTPSMGIDEPKISNQNADLHNRKISSNNEKYQQETRLTSSGQIFSDIKKSVFTRTKMAGLWIPALRESTTATGAPPDEYERPDDLKVVMFMCIHVYIYIYIYIYKYIHIYIYIHK